MLLEACAAAFHFTGDFSPEAFEATVRPSMEPPYQEAGFSGTLSAEHACLVRGLKKVMPSLTALPPELKVQHETYLWAFEAMYESHSMVCELHVGNKPGLLSDAADVEVPGPEKIRHLKMRTLKAAGSESAGS